MHVDLVNGQSAELRDAESFTRGERNDFYQQMRDVYTARKEAGEDADVSDGVVYMTIFNALVESWTIEPALPIVDPGFVDRMLAMDFSALDNATDIIMKKLRPVTNFAESTDPQSPTSPSS